jgi:hypothetical protein
MPATHAFVNAAARADFEYRQHFTIVHDKPPVANPQA